MPAFEIHFLLPLSNQPADVRSAFVLRAAASEPASDSERQYENPLP